MPDREDVTAILLRATEGSAPAREELYHLLYGELRRLAALQLRNERAHHTLQPTELVHEAYFRLVDQKHGEWRSRAHFFAIAGHAMRRILIDYARARGRLKRGRDWKEIPLDEVLHLGSDDAITTLVALDIALDRLAGEHPDAARVVELCFFGGLTRDECAAVMDFSLRTITRHWNFAQAWLYREMGASS